MRAEALKGHLDALLLATLADGPRHGYPIKEFIGLDSGGEFDTPRPAPSTRPCTGWNELGSSAVAWSVWQAESGGATNSPTPGGGRSRPDARTGGQFAIAVTGVLEGGTCPAPAGWRARLWRYLAGPAGANDVTAVIDGYLVNLASALPYPGSTSSAIVSEIEDGLMEAVSGYKLRGDPEERREAIQAAIGEFGEPATVAEAFPA